jgi:hypothetical protein
MPSKVLILNGPPNTGTYELAQLLAAKYDAVSLSTYAATLACKPRMIVHDLGFVGELQILLDTFGENNLLMAHLVKDNCTYDRDPRNYVDHPKIEAVTVVVESENITFTLGLLGFLFFELDNKPHA